jgi:hypothetical protein
MTCYAARPVKALGIQQMRYLCPNWLKESRLLDPVNQVTRRATAPA